MNDDLEALAKEIHNKKIVKKSDSMKVSIELNKEISNESIPEVNELNHNSGDVFRQSNNGSMPSMYSDK